MKEETLLEDVIFKINTSSLYLNYLYNSFDCRLQDYLTYSFKNIPNLGDLINFGEYVDDEKLVYSMMSHFNTTSFKVIERCCYVGALNYPVNNKKDHWLITLEPCYDFKSKIGNLDVSKIGKELIKGFELSISTIDILKKARLYDDVNLHYLAENFISAGFALDDESLIEISEIVEFYIEITKEENKFGV